MCLTISFVYTDCPACYNLVQDRVHVHRHELDQLKDLIMNIGNNPNAFNDTEFIKSMNEVNDSVNMLLMDARGAVSKCNEFQVFVSQCLCYHH